MLRRLTRAESVRVLLTEAAHHLEAMRYADPRAMEWRGDDSDENLPTVLPCLRYVKQVLEAIEAGILGGEF